MAWWQIVAMIGAGFGGAGGQIFVTKAYYYAPAKELSVFDYSQILFSAPYGICGPGTETGSVQYPGICDHLLYSDRYVFI